MSMTPEVQEAIRAGIRAMECMEYDQRHIDALEALLSTPSAPRQDLAAPVAARVEAAAWRYRPSSQHAWKYVDYELRPAGMDEQPLYAAPPIQSDEAVREFARICLRATWGDHDLDGDIQDAAERLGLIAKDPGKAVPCGEGCKCSNEYDIESGPCQMLWFAGALAEGGR
jgi:hypothetical protein